MSKDQIAPDWHRVVGAFSNVVPAQGKCLPTVGVRTYTCSCCGSSYVTLACVGEDGAEVSVTLPLEQAMDVVDAIANGVAAIVATSATVN